MIPQPIPQSPIVVDCTWKGIPMLQRVDRPEGGEAGPPASALALVEMYFANGRPCSTTTDTPLLSSAGASPGITIASAENWEITIPARILPLGTGRWNFIIIATAADGTRDPLVNGVLEIRPTA